jgi:UbiA prenyltransferase family
VSKPPQYSAVSSRIIRRRLTEVIRAGEWWEYKLVPIYAAFYATALTLDVAVSSLWRAALIVLASLVPGAAYVSVINDLTDCDDDLAAGKPNRLAGRSPWLAATLVALTAGMGVAISWLWRDDALLVTAYLMAWLAFSLYSWPPFRFKKRGLLGVLCDASGAHLFPTLVAVILAYRGAGRPVSATWLVAIAVWAFANGLRGILWHQLTDVANDRAAGVRTFAERHPRRAMLLGTYIAFPLELLALGTMLWLMRAPAPLVALGLYAYLTSKRMRHWKVNAVVVAPKPRFFIVLAEYYSVYLPVSILIASAVRHPRDWIVLGVHVVVFPMRLAQSLRDIGQLIRERRYPWT